ncbi:penicillin-binding transpeptidase domain-containing protein [Spirillospora sp. NPDC047279]|uniref:penicillin-binding transpeptidase domain-containing protein n=1 Tax=Spirillospora sp. NPDC047279 TaxID=3155478 RepID=UPI0033C393D4
MNMDKPLRRVAIFGLLLFFGLMAQVNYVQGSQAQSLREDPINTRKYLNTFNEPRGKIIAGPEILVTAVETGKANPKYGRKYKDGEVFAPITGYFTGSAGAGGLERAYNDLLSGQDKRLKNQKWFDTFIGKKAKAADIQTTIDPAAQRVAYSQLQQASGNRKGGAVVMDIKTGAIKVMASFPSYDPTTVAPQSGEAGVKRFDELNNSRTKPTVDKAMSDTNFPGSSFKTVVAASALDNGLNKDSSVPAPSTFNLPGTSVALPNSHEGGACGGAGQAPLILTFAESCNTTYGILGAEQLGKSKVLDTAKKFGYDQAVEVEPNMRTAKSSFVKPDADGAQTALASIGQGSNSATPLHMAMVAAAAANNGKIMKPYLVQKVISGDDGGTVQDADPKQFGQAMPGDNADQLADMMREVVRSGTAKSLAQFDIAGKTGTADIDGVEFNNRWFVGFAPADKPRYAFAVFTQGDGSGGEFAGPVAGRIMQAVRKDS